MEIPANGLETVTEETVESSGESLNSDKAPEANTKDIVKMAKSTKMAAKGQNPWDSAPADVLNAFTSLRNGESKAQAATTANTSTRTLGRWMDKYDYTGWAKAAEGSMTKAERARMMFNNAAWDTLNSFKRPSEEGLGSTWLQQA